uniref:Noncapsid protein n=1 Tax=Tenuivirus oryzabrevis TaxID=3052762 RepID=A0A0R5NFY9_9VIRU|nr:noncapsid protein [Tenuivirus oryzabrevis]
MSKSHSDVVGTVSGLNYRLFYDMIPDRISQKLRLREITDPRTCNASKIPLVLKAAEEVSRMDIDHDKDGYTKVQVKMPEYMKAYLEEMLSASNSTTTGISYSVFLVYMQDKCGDWITEHYLKNVHSMSKQQLHELITGIIETFSSDDIEDEHYDDLICKIPAYVYNIVLRYIDMSGLTT